MGKIFLNISQVNLNLYKTSQIIFLWYKKQKESETGTVFICKIISQIFFYK